MDAVSATIVASGRARLENTQRLIEKNNNYFNLLILPKPFDSGLGTNMRKAVCHSDVVDSLKPCRWRGGGFITMVVVFVGCLCCCGWTRDVKSSLYVKNGTNITLR